MTAATEPGIVSGFITRVVAGYEHLKQEWIPQDENLRALLHVHLGMAIWLIVALVFRRKLSSRIPLAAVWAVTVLMEAADLYHFWPVRHDWVWYDMASDLLNMLIWPTVLWIFLNWRERRRR